MLASVICSLKISCWHPVFGVNLTRKNIFDFIPKQRLTFSKGIKKHVIIIPNNTAITTYVFRLLG